MTETAGAASAVAPVTCGLFGPRGLGVEIFCGLLRAGGVVVADTEATEASSPVRVDVVVLVEPERQHWAAAQERGVPIVLVLGHAAADDEVVQAVLAGADAVLDADTSPDRVIRTLEEVSQGGSVLRPTQARMVAALARAAAGRPEVLLSRREAEIVASIADGKAVKQTARDLGISAKTVENLQGRLFRKLGVRNRAQAVVRAHQLGLL